MQFLVAFGSDPAQFPPQLLAEAAALAPLLRYGRPPFEDEVPFGEIRAATIPGLVWCPAVTTLVSTPCARTTHGDDGEIERAGVTPCPQVWYAHLPR